MKIQDLAIIFVIIIIPISLILSIYTQFQMQTISTQTTYDARLTSATYDAIKAFQLNSANSSTSDLATSKLRDLEASIATFRTSLKSAFELNGFTEEELNNYIPALVYTLYDGFYIYSPYVNVNHRYETDEDGNVVIDPETGSAKVTDDNGAKIYGLKPYITYSCRYVRGDIDVVITYALDNYVKVQGNIGTEYVNKSGYLIDNITITGNDVIYNGVTIQTEQLKENVAGTVYNYAKINGTKYYLINNQIVYFLNGIPVVQCKENSEQYISWKNLILNNDGAKQYYREAYEFTEWFKSTNLIELQYADACDEVIDDDGKINIAKVWSGNTTKIFEDNKNNIENKLSNFNQHRLAVIRHKIETNLAIAITNYNNYSGATNEFQMPELKEDEWDYITHNISLISFLQGLPIGGKIYNGYTIVTNSESKEVVLEENIYLLGSDAYYHKIGNKELENGGSVVVDNSGIYGESRSTGRLNLDFKRAAIKDDIGEYYYYPLKEYNASYDSIIMQNNVTTYDDIYAYVNSQSDSVKESFYTALGRERSGMYKVSNEVTYDYNVLVVGSASSDDVYEKYISQITSKLNEEDNIKATYIYSNDKTYLANYVSEQQKNYHLIIVDSFVWHMKIEQSKLLELSNETNIITISNDATGLELMNTWQTISIGENVQVTPQITDLGKNKISDIQLNARSDSGQAAFKFKDNVEVLYKGTYTKKSTGELIGEYDLIGCWKNGDNKWIHSQVSLNYNNTNDMNLLKSLVKYALNSN